MLKEGVTNEKLQIAMINDTLIIFKTRRLS